MLGPIQGSDWLAQLNNNFSQIGNGNYVKAYYVDNVSGSSANNGASWTQAFAQVPQAITAWEALRLTLPNVYGKGVIYVRGTGTAYTALTALPNYCDVIGCGAPSNGNGTGIAIIGANGADGITDTNGTTANATRGLGLFNLQIKSGGAFFCADFGTLLRSEIAYCTFQADTVATSGAIRFRLASGGNHIHHNWMTGNGNVCHVLGIDVQGPNFDSNKIHDNLIVGTTKGVYVESTCSTGINGTAADNTVFYNNFIGDFGRGCAVAIDDDEPAGMISYVNNVVMGTALIQMANNGAAHVHGNVSANGFVAVTAS
jgi:hypothetical protein